MKISSTQATFVIGFTLLGTGVAVSTLIDYNETDTSIFIFDDQVGGDCQKIGNWDPQSKTDIFNETLRHSNFLR